MSHEILVCCLAYRCNYILLSKSPWLSLRVLILSILLLVSVNLFAYHNRPAIFDFENERPFIFDCDERLEHQILWECDGFLRSDFRKFTHSKNFLSICITDFRILWENKKISTSTSATFYHVWTIDNWTIWFWKPR